MDQKNSKYTLFTNKINKVFILKIDSWYNGYIYHSANTYNDDSDDDKGLEVF